jgi:malate dehydrogenase
MPGFKVTVVGSCGHIGQSLSMLLKLNPHVSELSVCDLQSAQSPPQGLSMDLSHIVSTSLVKSYIYPQQLSEAVKGSDLIVVTAGTHWNPSMLRDDPFSSNAKIMKEIAQVTAKHSTAMVVIVTNPVNCMVPLFAEVYKQMGVYDPKRLMGLTAVDVARACVFYSEKTRQDPSKVQVPVVGGHDYGTTVPLFSQATPKANLSQQDMQLLTKRCQIAGAEVSNLKGGSGSATLSVAYAANSFVTEVLKGMTGQTTTACAYVDCGNGDFFAGPVEFNKSGASRLLPIPSTITDFEKQMISEVKQTISSNIKAGTAYVTTGSTLVGQVMAQTNSFAQSMQEMFSSRNKEFKGKVAPEEARTRPSTPETKTY